MLLEEGVCYDQCILLAKLLLTFSLLHSVLQFYIIPVGRRVIQSRRKGGKKELGMKFRGIQGKHERQKDF